MLEAPALMEQAMRLWRTGRPAEAAVICQRLLASDPRHVQALVLMGALRWQAGAAGDAIHYLDRAVREQPYRVDVRFNLARIHHAQNDREPALGHARQAARLVETAEDCAELGWMLVGMGDGPLAEDLLRRAVAAQSQRAEWHGQLAEALVIQWKLDEAEAAARRALDLAPGLGQPWYALGCVAQRRGAPADAQRCFERMLEVMPQDPCGRFMRACTLLQLGDYHRGLEEFEWRTRLPRGRLPALPLAAWDGSPQATVLVTQEQGWGDTIQFARYLPLLRRHVGGLVFACQPQLGRLMASCAGIDRLVCGPELSVSSLAPARARVALLSLPRMLGTTLENLPAPTAYLAPDPADVARWRARLGEGAGLRVGLAWAGRPQHENDAHRSCRLDDLAALAEIPNVSWYALQTGPAAAQAAAPPPGMRLVDLSPDLHDFAETAAVMTCLDLVVTVDTSVCHLAGAIGRPVWTLLPAVADWRWLLDRQDSPWYPTMRLFRQEREGEWGPVVHRVASALGDLATGR